MKTGTPRTPKTMFLHWKGCIFEGFQHLGKSIENDSKISPKMTPKSMTKWSRSLSEGLPKKACKKITIFNEQLSKSDPGRTPKLSQNPSQIYQNGGQELRKGVGQQFGSRNGFWERIGVFLGAFFVIWTICDAILEPSWAPRGFRIHHFGIKTHKNMPK